MTLILYLNKVRPGEYQAVVQSGGVEVTAPTMHSSLSQALSEVARSVPSGIARFIEPRYEGCTTGTIAIEDLHDQCERVAMALVDLVARMRNEDGFSDQQASERL